MTVIWEAVRFCEPACKASVSLLVPTMPNTLAKGDCFVCTIVGNVLIPILWKVFKPCTRDPSLAVSSCLWPHAYFGVSLGFCLNISIFIYLRMYLHMCVCADSRHTVEFGFLLPPRGFWRSISGSQAWWQGPLPPPSHLTRPAFRYCPPPFTKPWWLS